MNSVKRDGRPLEKGNWVDCASGYCNMWCLHVVNVNVHVNNWCYTDKKQ